jgi:hypothetical protein
MKQVDNKDLPSVPGGTSVPGEAVHIGGCFPPFPLPDPSEPYVPLPLPPTYSKL